jgi:hypothetical protein
VKILKAFIKTTVALVGGVVLGAAFALFVILRISIP